MKIFHLSDLHLGLKLMNYDLFEDQRYVLKEIVNYASVQQPDAIVIAGDIYDRAVPSAEAVRLFDSFITELSEVVPNTELMMISGNHDSGPRIDLYRNILKNYKVHMIGIPPQTPEEHIEKIVLEDPWGEVCFYLLPFVKPSMVKSIVGCDENGNNLSYEESVKKLLERESIETSMRNVLVSHQFYLPAGTEGDKVERMDSEIQTAGNIDAISASVISIFDYAALGHIHKPMKVGSEILRYCGTPIACSVSECGQQKGIVMVELEEKGKIKTSVLPLRPLREIHVIEGELEEVLKKSCDDYVRVELTDTVEYDAVDLQNRLRNAFPYLLEIRRRYVRTVNYSAYYSEDPMMNPEELCRKFLNDSDEDDLEELRNVINTVMEEHR